MSRGSRRWRVIFAAYVVACGSAAHAASAEEGRRLYELGAADPAMRVIVDGLELDADRFACVGCHGELGEGRDEGGIVAPAIDWSALTQPRHGFRARPPYDVRRFVRVLAEGLDPLGRTLDPGMPRYRLTEPQAQSLIAHLRRLSRSAVTGVDARRVRIALLTVDSGPFADLGQRAKRAALDKAAAENARGGAYGRAIELVPLDVSGADTADRLEARLRQSEVLAAAATFSLGRAEDVAAALDALALPNLFPIEPAAEPRSQLVALRAPATAQAERLTRRWLENGAETGLLIADDRPLSQTLAAVVQRTADGAGARLTRVSVDTGDAERAASYLRAADGVVFAFVDAGTLKAALARVAIGGPALRIYGLLDQIGQAALASDIGARFVLANPRARPAGAISTDGALGVEGEASMAVEALAESLRRAGRRVTRARLVGAAQGLARASQGVELIELD